MERLFDSNEADNFIERIYENTQIRHLFFQHPKLMYSIIEVDDDLDHGTLSYYSPSWTKETGYTDDEIKNMNFLDMIHPEDKKIYDMERQYLYKTGQSGIQFYAYRFRKANGKYMRIQAAKPMPLSQTSYLVIQFAIPEGQPVMKRFTRGFETFLKVENNRVEYDNVIRDFLKDSGFKDAFFNNNQVLYCFITGDYEMVRVSPSSAKVLGYLPSELENVHVSRIADEQNFRENSDLYDYMTNYKKKSWFMHPAMYKTKKGKAVKFQCLDPIYLKESDMWLLRAYQIDKRQEGITLLTDEYKEWKQKTLKN